MKKLVLAVAVCGVLACAASVPVLAEDAATTKQEKPHKQHDVTIVKGDVTKVEEKKITVGEQSFVIDDKTEIVSGGAAYKEPLKVGQKITARIKDGVAVRIEVQPAKPHTGKHPL